MKNKTFYIFRHAIATYSNQGYGDKIVTAEILPEGVSPIKKLAAYLKNIESDYNVCSEFLRCRQTAEIVQNITGKHFAYDKRLNEVYQETLDEFEKRVRSFYEEMNSLSYRSIVICTHGAVINTLKMLVRGEDFDEEKLNINPKNGELIVIKGENIEKIDFNSI